MLAPLILTRDPGIPQERDVAAARRTSYLKGGGFTKAALLALVLLQDVTELLKKFEAGDDDAAAALVKKGIPARSPVQKALEKAPDDQKPRYEELLLRIEAGTDSTSETFGTLEFTLREGGAIEDSVPQITRGLRLKAVFEGNVKGDKPVSVTITKSTIHTLKGKQDMVVRGSKGETFTRTFDPQAPKMFEYGAVIPSRLPPGTRVVLAFEIEVDGKKKLIRSPILTIEKKKE